jgi:hypothetical protein
MRLLHTVLPWDSGPKFILRDRDGSYGDDFTRVVHPLGIEHVLTAARPPGRIPRWRG